MSGGIAVVQYDTDPLIYGVHKGQTGLTIIQANKDFLSCGAFAGLAVQNTTTLLFGHVVSASETSVLTDITFHNGDGYSIYHTGIYNSVISKYYTDRRFAHKVTEKDELIDGLFPEDRDINEGGEKVFGEGQPWETKI